jgi:hypothetical protein
VKRKELEGKRDIELVEKDRNCLRLNFQKRNRPSVGPFKFHSKINTGTLVKREASFVFPPVPTKVSASRFFVWNKLDSFVVERKLKINIVTSGIEGPVTDSH